MERNEIILKVKAKLIEKKAKIDILDFIKNKLKMKIPSKEKAIKILKRYTDQDVEEAYKNISDIVDVFNRKKAGLRDVFTPKFFKNIVLLSALVSIVHGAFPVSSDDAKDEIRKVLHVGHSYYGRLNSRKVIDITHNSEDITTVQTRVAEALKKDPSSLSYRGEDLPKNIVASKIILSDTKIGSGIRDIEKLKKVKGSIYLFLSD